jgi:hypothetical protein
MTPHKRNFTLDALLPREGFDEITPAVFCQDKFKQATSKFRITTFHSKVLM